MKARMKGLATVEFAVVGALFLAVLIGVIEMGRALFVWNSIAEGTRRAARLAAVCPIGSSAIAEVAILNSPDSSNTDSQALHGLTTQNVSVTYLDSAGAQTASFDDTRYVRVAISGYQHTLLIPFLEPTITVPPFTTTVPSESLGLNNSQCD